MFNIATLPNLSLIQITVYLALGVICQNWIPTPYLMCLWGYSFFLIHL